MRRRSAYALTFLALAFAASACVGPNRSGVSIDSVEADVIFGGKTDATPVLPANTDASAIPDAALGAGYELPPFRNPAADRLPPLASLGGSNTDETCPTAPPTAGADKPADVTITGEVREGIYLWKRDGTQKRFVDGQDEPVTTEITGFERRIVRNVQPYEDEFDPEAYTFEMVQTLIDRPVVQVRTFLVKPQTSAQVAPGGAVVVDEPRANDPEGGISLLKVEEFDENDTSLGTFEPSTGLLMLGLPVDPAEAWQATATDPKGGQSIVQEAQVRGRSRIDACGDLVDGWRVETTQTRTDVAGEATYNYLLATQYGGVPILEEVQLTAPDGSEINVTFTLGQLDPDPLQ